MFNGAPTLDKLTAFHETMIRDTIEPNQETYLSLLE